MFPERSYYVAADGRFAPYVRSRIIQAISAGRFDCHVADLTYDMVLLSLQGPKRYTFYCYYYTALWRIIEINLNHHMTTIRPPQIVVILDLMMLRCFNIVVYTIYDIELHPYLCYCSRDILQRASPDVELSNERFPFSTHQVRH